MKRIYRNHKQNPGASSAPPSRLLLLALALLPFLSVPLIGTQLYFRHDDSAVILWAKEFTSPFYHAVSPDPAVNGFDKYPGMGPYWRPFVYLYVKGLWNFFGLTAGPYYVVGGLLFMIAVYFLFRLAEQRWGLATAVWSCLALMAAFYGSMYNLYHLTIQVSFFYQITLLYFFWAYLQNQRWPHLLGMLVFLAPAMSRQTTPVLMVAILVAVLLEQRKQALAFLRNNWLALVLLLPSFYLISLSPQTSEGSVLAEGANVAAIIAFLRERFFYYGGLLTSGITGVLLLPLIGGGVLHHLAGLAKTKFHFDKAQWLWPPLTFILAFGLMALQPFAIYWFVFCCIYLFIIDDQLRLPIAWAGASLICFLSAKYYHNGYLLEAGFALALAMGVLIMRLSQPLVLMWQRFAVRPRVKIPMLAGGAALLAAPFALVLAGKTPALAEPFEVVKIAFDSNQNFQELMNYLRDEMPSNAALYEFTEEELGTTRFDRRHISLRERARRVKIMNAEDKRVMLRALDRSDLQIHPAAAWQAADQTQEAYFLACNNFEKEMAQQQFDLIVVKEFRRATDSAAIYRLVREATATASPAAPSPGGEQPTELNASKPAL